jgi:hypothetical protein
MARGRPASTTPAWECHIHLRLRVGEDDDLIAFLSNLPSGRRALALKVALRSGGMQTGQIAGGGIDDDLAAAVDDFLK